MIRSMLGILSILSLLALVSCGGGSSPTQNNMAPPSGTMTTVSVGDNFFSPQSVTVNPGDTVKWVLTGSNTMHTVTDNGGAFNSGMVFTSTGATFQHTFTSADAGKTFNYICQTHAVCCGMRGAVSVGANAPPPSPGY
jgi:plastocyanin